MPSASSTGTPAAMRSPVRHTISFRKPSPGDHHFRAGRYQAGTCLLEGLHERAGGFLVSLQHVFVHRRLHRHHGGQAVLQAIGAGQFLVAGRAGCPPRTPGRSADPSEHATDIELSDRPTQGMSHQRADAAQRRVVENRRGRRHHTPAAPPPAPPRRSAPRSGTPDSGGGWRGSARNPGHRCRGAAHAAPRGHPAA